MSNSSVDSRDAASLAPQLGTPVDWAPTHLKAECGVRYWEDATVNGVCDEEGDLIPWRRGEDWRPLIDLQTGRIEGWPPGTVADIHYKVCDDGRYALLNAAGQEICAIEGYVPAIMSPGGSGHGDYVIMTIGPDGEIANWRRDLEAFREALSREAARDMGSRVAAQVDDDAPGIAL